jgi:hypothetical protein
MRNFLATVLSVIAVGVTVIAYGVISPRMAASDVSPYARPVLASQRVGDIEDLTPRMPFDPAQVRPFDPAQGRPVAYRVGDDGRAVPVYADMRSAPAFVERPVIVSRPVRVTRTVRVQRAPRRDWAKTAMVIGGTTAAGAGLGAIFGGKKGALIGAAIGGGAGTIYEVRKR